MTYGTFFPLIFCPWTQIYMQNAKGRTNIVFSNSLRSYVNVMMVDFKRLYLLFFLNSAWKFVFRDKNWVEEMPYKSFLDWLVKVLQIRRGCVIKIGNNLRAFSPQKYPTMTIYWPYFSSFISLIGNAHFGNLLKISLKW